MKKISSLIVAIFVVGVMNTQAQGIELGIKGGLTIPKIGSGGNDTPLSEGYSSIMSWGGGAFADFKITKTLSLQVGLEYIQEGGQKEGVQALPALKTFTGMAAANPTFPLDMNEMIKLLRFLPNDYIYADFKSVAHFDYLMLPIQAKFGWNLSQNSPFRFYASGGIFGAYLLSSERTAKGTFPPFYADANKGSLLDRAKQIPGYDALSPDLVGFIDALGVMQVPIDNKEDITEEIRRLNFGLIAAIGLSYQIAPRHKVLVEAGGNYGLIKLQKEPVNGENCIGAASIMLGYAMSIGN